jgi:hypothetical protein
MSHRIVINTELNDKAALEVALKANDWPYEMVGTRVRIQAGPGAGGSVELKTGKFHGDSDLHTPARMAPLLQAYGEALWMNRFADNNGYLESRTILEDGTIRLVGTVMVA